MDSHHRNTGTASATVVVKCALIAILLLGVISQCSAVCRRQPLIHSIVHEGCQTKRLRTFGCRGTCNSYSRVSPTDYTQMERSCQCCQESQHVVGFVELNCPSLSPPTQIVEFRHVRSCSCRPCNSVSGVPRVTRLEDLE
ncbi:bursicon-like [Asterias rubens]|uniref:Bursicon n=1 Tax=Asterias rubens TaxID=7604 RepID=A0A0U2Q695_ASTRU|nr:bursicon-like [Asterias rubens]ALJ99968.1 bursicon alpha-type precursor [Asterias rubens]